jgi:hypothetical protein
MVYADYPFLVPQQGSFFHLDGFSFPVLPGSLLIRIFRKLLLYKQQPAAVLKWHLLEMKRLYTCNLYFFTFTTFYGPGFQARPPLALHTSAKYLLRYPLPPSSLVYTSLEQGISARNNRDNIIHITGDGVQGTVQHDN